MTSKKELLPALSLTLVLLVVGVISYAAFPAKSPDQPVRLMFKGVAGKVLFTHKCIHLNPVMMLPAATAIIISKKVNPTLKPAVNVMRPSRRMKTSPQEPMPSIPNVSAAIRKAKPDRKNAQPAMLCNFFVFIFFNSTR